MVAVIRIRNQAKEEMYPMNRSTKNTFNYTNLSIEVKREMEIKRRMENKTGSYWIGGELELSFYHSLTETDICHSAKVTIAVYNELALLPLLDVQYSTSVE